MKHEMISCNWILAKISISWVDTGPSVFFLLKEKDDTPVVSLGTEVARSCHYYIIPFCEALKKVLGGGHSSGPPRLIVAGPPAVQPSRLIYLVNMYYATRIDTFIDVITFTLSFEHVC